MGTQNHNTAVTLTLLFVNDPRVVTWCVVLQFPQQSVYPLRSLKSMVPMSYIYEIFPLTGCVQPYLADHLPSSAQLYEFI